MRLPQRRRVVGTVAAHADDMSVLLQRLDQTVLVLGQHAGEDGEFFRLQRLGQRRGGIDHSLDSDDSGDDLGGHPGISGHHHRAHAQAGQFGDQGRRVPARWIAERDEPGHFQLRRRA